VCVASGTAAIASPVATVAEGFVVEQVADSPLVDHPMMGCFDDRGRLYVCESAGTNRPASELVADPQDQIRILSDVDGDGHFDTSTVFADKLVFPQGCLWYRGAVYTCSSPYVWKLEDTDGDDVCDKRSVLVKSFGFSGNAADIHGPFLGPDGRFYWCDGRHGHEIRDLGEEEFGGDDTAAATPPDPEPGLPNPDGSLLTKGKAARIFSCRPDGSDVRVLCGGGMDNPVEVDFFETGECLGTVNLFYGVPRGDCLVHWIEGRVPRYDQADSVAEFKSTGELLTEVHNYGHVAVSGTTRYRTGPLFSDAEALPDSAEFVVTQFNTHKVVHTVIQRDGATFRHVATRDLFVSPYPDCHPTDVIEDADGSLLVIDTGGWFRIGCPTSQIAKPQITGAIYRIRRKGTSYTQRHSLLAEIQPQSEPIPPVEFAKAFRRAGRALRDAVVDRIAQESQHRPQDMVGAMVDILVQNDPNEDGMAVAAYWTLSRIPGGLRSGWVTQQVEKQEQLPLALISIGQLSSLPMSVSERDRLVDSLGCALRE
jgi:putative membrane-bound dehydrogenase-like protein